jgi:penicillin-binding protein 1A
LNSWKRKLLYGAAGLCVVGVLGGLAVSGLVAYFVYFGDVSELKKSTILARINEETTLYTLDEEHKIGSFFDDEHRSYVTIDQVPEDMIRAMVAAEDKNFFQHFGIDPVAISLAFWEGVQNGFRFRRGGSSITQQTVKNVMDHREHSFRRKVKELIRALQLERMYSKQQILEFYLNQFHVTANGKGIGIAARYYFNKDVKELNLVESAFIAGSVKAPSKYNPFIKYTREDTEEAW